MYILTSGKASKVTGKRKQRETYHARDERRSNFSREKVIPIHVLKRKEGKKISDTLSDYKKTLLRSLTTSRLWHLMSSKDCLLSHCFGHFA